jgi:hypothetical protein
MLKNIDLSISGGSFNSDFLEDDEINQILKNNNISPIRENKGLKLT